MTIAKVIEVMAAGENIEAAIQTGVTEAADTEQGIKQVYV
jgi:flavin-binding protein dodecin